jgi:hypothetical protein
MARTSFGKMLTQQDSKFRSVKCGRRRSKYGIEDRGSIGLFVVKGVYSNCTVFQLQYLTSQAFAIELDQCFAPTERLRDIWEGLNYTNDPFERNEVKLVVPAEEFLKIQWDWDDLWAFISADVQRKFLWLADDTFIGVDAMSDFHSDTPYDRLLIASSTTTSGEAQTLTLIKKMDADESTEAFSVFWRAIETNKNAEILIQGDGIYSSKLPSGPSLAQFLRGRPLLQPPQSLDFRNFSFTEERCRALATTQRTGLKVKLIACTIRPEGA